VIAGTEVARRACQLPLGSETGTLEGIVIGNYKKLQQWIYEFCYQLGMHLKFHHRRRIQNDPMARTIMMYCLTVNR